MPLSVSPTTIRQILRPVLAVRENGEYRVTVAPETIRLHGLRVDKTAYLDYSVPIPSRHAPIVDTPHTFVVNLEKLNKFLNAGSDGTVSIRFPFETHDSRIVVCSEQLTYRFPAIDSDSASETWAGSPVDTLTTITVNHRYLHRTVQAANLAGDFLRLVSDPVRSHVEFRTPADDIGDRVRYPLSDDQITAVTGVRSHFVVSVHVLREVTKHIPASHSITIEITPDHLVYRVEYPAAGATFTLFMAEKIGVL